MRLSKATFGSALGLMATSQLASAQKVIESHSLDTCMPNSKFTADLFDLAVFPGNHSISLEMTGRSQIDGVVVAVVEVIAYGFTAVNQTLNPCTSDMLKGFCPLTSGEIPFPASNIPLGADIFEKIPGAAYIVPDLDAKARIKVYLVNDQGGIGEQVACLEADLSNTKSVYQKAVGWITAIIAGAGLIAAGITSGLGNTNTAAHVAANAVSLFGAFQAQALIGLTAVSMPPIVQAWTQNFQWSMGIIRVGFLQQLATWYQRSTGGKPTTYLSTLSTISVQVEKRALAVKRGIDTAAQLLAPVLPSRYSFMKRQSTSSDNTALQNIIVRGISRVGFRAHIERTNIFMTGLIFFIGILIVAAICVALAKAILEGLAKGGKLRHDQFRDFRNGWRIIIKGILFRLVLLGWVQMSILCLWELTQRDSAAEAILAVIVFLSMAACLGWASFKVMTLAKRSIDMHKNPAYILYSDPTCLNKWGFLYVSYKATSYWFVIVFLGYILVKSIFVALCQSVPVVQAAGLLVVEGAMLITVCVLQPWMDKKTNIFNITIASINFLNSICLLIFSNAFGAPPAAAGVTGVLFVLVNLIFILVLLIMVLVSSIYAIASKNPETRYQPMRDDRTSFIKSQSALTTELDALGQTARGEPKDPYTSQTKEIDPEVSSNESLHKPVGFESQPRQPHQNLQPGNVYTPAQAPPSPASPAHPPPQFRQDQSPAQGYRPNTAPGNRGPPPQSFSRPGPGAYAPPRSAHGNYPPQNFNRPPPHQQDRTASPWQRGAGYD